MDAAAPTSPQKSNPFTTVTPLSKALALLLFITLPIGMFFLGMYIQTQSQIATIQPAESVVPTSTVAISPTPDETANWKTYENSQFRFSFKYPQEWVEEGSQGDSNLLTSFAKRKDTRTFLLVETRQEQNLSNCFPTNLSKGDIVSTAGQSIGGVDGKKYIIDVKKNESFYPIVYSVVNDNRCYVLEFMPLTREEREINSGIVESIARTFKFTK